MQLQQLVELPEIDTLAVEQNEPLAPIFTPYEPYFNNASIAEPLSDPWQFYQEVPLVIEYQTIPEYVPWNGGALTQEPMAIDFEYEYTEFAPVSEGIFIPEPETLSVEIAPVQTAIFSTPELPEIEPSAGMIGLDIVAQEEGLVRQDLWLVARQLQRRRRLR